MSFFVFLRRKISDKNVLRYSLLSVVGVVGIEERKISCVMLSLCTCLFACLFVLSHDKCNG